MMKKDHFSGKLAIITGAANGVGRALSLELARRGCNLGLIDIDRINLNQTKSDCEEHGINCRAITSDVGDFDTFSRASQDLVNKTEPVHFLFNNAAVSIKANLEDQDVADILWINRINTLGILFCTKIFLPNLKKADKSHIVFISSGAGLQGFPGRTTYCASKFALTGIAESLQSELFHTSVRTSCAFLGPVSTEMFERSRYTNQKDKIKEQKYLTKKGMAPEQVAIKIINGTVKGKSRILISRETKLLSLLKRIAPAGFSGYISKNQDKLPV